MADSSLTTDQILQKLFDPASNTIGTTSASPSVQPVSIATMPVTPITGNVTADTGLLQPLTNAQLRASPVPVSGSVTVNTGLTDAQLRATPAPITTNDRNSDTVVITAPNVALISVLVAAANPNRKSIRLYNNSTNSVYLCAVASGASSATNLFAIVATFAAFEFNTVNYRGPISAIRNAGTGAVVVTEFI